MKNKLFGPINIGLSNGVAALLLFIIAFPSAQTTALYRVNCGGPSFINPYGQIWLADQNFVGGQIFGVADSTPILNTNMPKLYQTERWNDPTLENLKYVFPAPEGAYNVKLHFAEIYDGYFEAGKRVFDVNINDSAVAKGVDVFAQAGADAALVSEYTASSVDGKIKIEFVNQMNNAKISGIEIVPLNPFHATKAPYRIHCGGEDFIDPNGNYWEADGHYTGGNVTAVANQISNTDMSYIYQTERWNDPGQPNLSYAFDVDDGSYTVRLHFAEIYFTDVGQRIFGVDINGASVISDLDLIAEAGANTAVVKEFTTESADGKIVIDFRNGSANNAKISGIEILPAATTGLNGAALRHGNTGITVTGEGRGAIRVMANGDFKVEVMDCRGKNVAAADGRSQKTLSDLRSGLYFVKVMAGRRSMLFRIPVM